MPSLPDLARVAYESHDYAKSLEYYTQAIQEEKTASLLGNRASVYAMLGDFEHGINDVREALRMEPERNVRSWKKLVRLYLLSGNFSSAEIALNDVPQVFLSEVQKEYHTIRTQFEHCLESEKNACKALGDRFFFEGKKPEDLSTVQSESLIMQCVSNWTSVYRAYQHSSFCQLGVIRSMLLEDYLEQAKAVARSDHSSIESVKLKSALQLITSKKFVNCPDQIVIHGLLKLAQGSLSDAVRVLTSVLSSYPEAKGLTTTLKRIRTVTKAKEVASSVYASKDYEGAFNEFSKTAGLIRTDPPTPSSGVSPQFFSLCCTTIMGQVVGNMSACRLMQKRYVDALNLAKTAVEFTPTNEKLYMRIKQAAENCGSYEEAIFACATLYRMSTDPRTKRSWLAEQEKMESLKKKAERKDYYELLGVGKNFTEDELKKAYRRQSMKYHPDRVASLNDEEKEEATRKFQDIQEGYEVLKDPQKKAIYDNGGDPNSSSGGFPGGFSGFPGGGFGGFPGGFSTGGGGTTFVVNNLDDLFGGAGGGGFGGMEDLFQMFTGGGRGF